MAKLHLRPKDDVSWEFLGTFQDAFAPSPKTGHDYKDKAQGGHVYGHVLTIPGTVQEIEDKRADRCLLVNLPTAWVKRLKLRMPLELPWEQVAGYWR